jgi:ribosomal protein L40E
MQCPECGAENRGGSNFCRTCGYTLPDSQGTSGYIPSVPPPEAKTYQQPFQAAPPPQPPQVRYPQQPPPPMPYAWNALICPRCSSPNTVKGGPPLWAILLAVILAIPTCLLSLFFLLIKDPNRCLNCGIQFR